MKKDIIENTVVEMTKLFWEGYVRNRHYDLPEINDSIIGDIVREFLSSKTLTEANKVARNTFDKYIPDGNLPIDWKLDREELKKTYSYIQFSKYEDACSAWYWASRDYNLDETWVRINGQVRTDDEAAELAANKWCELLFGWHLQDNGAINETHAGGFLACALGTVLANDSKKDITEEMQLKAKNLIKEYYLHDIEYHKTDIKNAIEWAQKTLPDNDEKNPFDWAYGFGYGSMHCDYGPSTPLYLILINAGIPERAASNICPWKTGIEIRTVDNAVFLNTYQHQEEL